MEELKDNIPGAPSKMSLISCEAIGAYLAFGAWEVCTEEEAQNSDKAFFTNVKINGEEYCTYIRPRDLKFINELAEVINRHSKENDSNTPDFILAEYLVECLRNFSKTSRGREKWYGKSLEI